MDIFKIAAIGMVAATLAIILKKSNPEIAMHVSIAAGVLIFLMVISYLENTIDFIREISNKYPQIYDSVKIVIKIIGIAYICEFAVQILKDAGENAVASKVELAGKLIIMVITIPMMSTFLDMVVGILSKN